MKAIYQIFGGALGWTLGGPLGGVLGAVLGNLAHDLVTEEEAPRRISTKKTREADFHMSVLVLAAVVIKADGHVDSRELEFVRRGFVKMFGKQRANESFRLFKDVVQQKINTRQVSDQVRRHTTHAMRLQIVHFLLQIAVSDGSINANEERIIRRIAAYLYVRKPDFESLMAMFVSRKDPNAHYTILEINKSATDQEVKAAYRKMAKKYHPDKLTGLGEDVRKAAREKFLKVQEAYDAICRERGI